MQIPNIALADEFDEIRADNHDAVYAFAVKAQHEIRRLAAESKHADDFEQKIVNASWQIMQGDPLKDFLTDAEIEEAVKKLADIYTAIGVSPNIN
jgi:hypothetical protein